MDVEIRELNLTYLMLAKRLLLEDRETAMLQMQMSEEMADLLLELPNAKLVRLAEVNQFLFRLRFNEGRQLERLVQGRNGQGMEQIHAALLLSSTAQANVA